MAVGGFPPGLSLVSELGRGLQGTENPGRHGNRPRALNSRDSLSCTRGRELLFMGPEGMDVREGPERMADPME